MRHVIPTKWRSYRDHKYCDVTSTYVLRMTVRPAAGRLLFAISITDDDVYYTVITAAAAAAAEIFADIHELVGR